MQSISPQLDPGPILQTAIAFWSSKGLLTAVEFDVNLVVVERKIRDRDDFAAFDGLAVLLEVFGQFGFVELAQSEDLQRAIAGLNGQSLEGRRLTVNEARPHPASFSGPQGGGGGAYRGRSDRRRGY